MTTSKPVERGWPIVLRTNCRVGAHAFTWATIDRDDSREPLDKTLRCDCRAVTWEEVHEQR